MTAPATKPELYPDGAFEGAVLARMLWDAEAAVELADQLVPDDFIEPEGRAMFVLLAGLAATGQATDPISVRVRLKADGRTELLELYYWLAAHSVLTIEMGVGAQQLTKAFKEHSYAERFKQIITGAALALELGKPTGKIERRVEERMIALQSSAKNDRVFDDRKKQHGEVVDYYAERGKTQLGLTFGIEKIDRELLPIRPGNLFVIAGRQKAGKSTVARNFYDHWSATEKGVVFSLEMSSLEQWVNLACLHSGVAITSYYRQTMTADEQRRFGEALGRLQNGNLTINDRAHLTPEKCLRAMSRYLADGNTFYVLDHLHRFDYGESKDSDLRIPIGNFVRDLKNFAMTHKVQVVALSQLTKGSVHDEPDASSYRETSKIGEECDGSFFVYKPLVACDPQTDGTLRPITTSTGGRLFAHDKKPKEAAMGVDEENVYLVPANFRIAPSTVLFRVPFNKTTGKLHDEKRYPFANV